MARNWKAAREKVVREGECRLCAERLGLEAAHVVPRSLGGGMSELDVIPLCPSCHRSVDAGEVDFLHILTYAEQAEAVRILGIERAHRRFCPTAYPSKLPVREAA